MKIQSWPQAQVPPELRAQVQQLHEQEWGAAGWHDPLLDPVSMLLINDDGKVLGVLDILSKPLHHAGRSYTASGLSAVVTAVAARRRGHGRQLVSAAHAAVRASGADLGIFTCDRPLQGFYESSGWHLLPGTVLVGGTPEDPFPSDQPGFDKVTMGDLFTPRSGSSAGLRVRAHRALPRRDRQALVTSACPVRDHYVGSCRWSLPVQQPHLA